MTEHNGPGQSNEVRVGPSEVRATEEIRRLLDERGVKWWEGWDKNLTNFDGTNGVRYQADCTLSNILGKVFIRSILPITPEQAIAATLGGVSSEVGSKVGSEVCGGKLTAEQVRKAIEHHGIASLGCRWQFIDRSYEAIADELNATLGSETCHMSFIDEYETASGEEEYLCECSECGYRRWEPAHDLPLFCSKCGRKVKQ
ncbi:MAG: hypothetical protein IJ131_09710 [Eggerthellaceae bacterium]|nr:hypothetical protein [Eggerthellaceae bacterium]